MKQFRTIQANSECTVFNKQIDEQFQNVLSYGFDAI